MAAAGNNTRFAVTCELLRQYMREQQQQQQLAGALDGAFRLPPPLVETTATEKDEVDTDGRTMQLFPTRAGTLQPPKDQRPEAQAKARLTIVYEDRVLVFEDFPTNKAEELMQLAGSSGSAAATPQNKSAPPAAEKPASKQPAAVPDMPIARKASLQRFLQKRKHRINAAEPYNKETASPVPEKDITGSVKLATDEPAAAASWLGL